jgi:putative ABC transport system permease protein
MNWEWISALRLRIRALMLRRRLDNDLQAELEFHLEERTRHSGLPPDEARRRFGNATVYKETIREMWTFPWIETLRQDLRYAARTLLKSPGFTIVAVLTLAVGIGANTSIFSVVDAVILRPLPYPEPARLVELWGNVKRAKVERRGASFPDYKDWRAQSTSFEAMAAFDTGTATLIGIGEPERITGEYVSQPYFDLLGVRPALGRTFRPEEDEVPQRDAVAILSDALWKRRFGADPAIIGKPVQLDTHVFTIIGVMPPWFRGVTDQAEAWIPFMMSGSQQDMAERGNRGFVALARLKRGVTHAQAQTEFDAISKRLEKAWPATNEGRAVEVAPLDQELFGDIRQPLVVLLCAVGFVLLIACTNVANLLLARAEARHREIALRIALGAGRGRVLSQLTTESCLLASISAALGLLIANWGIRALMAGSPVNFPSYIRPGMDLRVAAFTVLITAAVGLLLGLAPAAQVRPGNLHDAFKQSSNQSSGTRGAQSFRGVLVVAEVAFAALLLIGAGLMIRSVRELAAIRPGYDTEHVLTLRLNLPRLAASTDANAAVTAREVLRRVAAVPSVEAVAGGTDTPLDGASAFFYTAEGQAPLNAQNYPRAYAHRVTPEFFKTLRIPFTAGRTFTETELNPSSNVVVVSEAVVKRFWPDQDPIGKRIKAGGFKSSSPWLTIVGVVNEMKYCALPNNPTSDPDVFFPFTERRGFALLVRTPLDPASLAPAVRKVVRDSEPGAVIYNVTTMTELASRETARSRFTGWLMGIFATSALALAMIGIYGVMSYAVTRRTQEIGIRMALGAARSEVLGLVVRNGMRLIGIGLAIGIGAAFVLTSLIASLLYGVKPTDPLAFAAAAAALALVALVACLVPASRATRIAPASALRNE